LRPLVELAEVLAWLAWRRLAAAFALRRSMACVAAGVRLLAPTEPLAAIGQKAIFNLNGRAREISTTSH
jgi:hypothetical protein